MLINDQMPDLSRYAKPEQRIDALYQYVYNLRQQINHVLSNLDGENLGADLKSTIAEIQKAVSEAVQTGGKQEQTQEQQQGQTGITEEKDPTVAEWAKQPEKPTYSKAEVGLGNVDDVRQYSESNPPPYPVTSVNGQTGAVTIPVSSTGKKSHTVTVNTSFVNSSYITAYSAGGILVVGGYLETKKQHPTGTNTTICTISGVQVHGLNYAAVANHNSSTEKTFMACLLSENGTTRAQLEGAAYALAAGSWINFTLVGVVN